jgi:GntR family transcriptional regulator of arabinose operon
MDITQLPKYYLIKEGILEYARREGLRPGGLLPSENELAARYGVTKVTASRALNELVSEGVVYRVRGKGTFISSLNSTDAPEIIVYSPYKEMDVYFYDPLMHSMVETIHNGGCRPILRYVAEGEKFAPGREVSAANALVVFAGCINQGIREDIARDLKVPVIYYGCRPDANASYVYADDEGGTEAALRHLVDLGHSKVFYMQGSNTSIAFNHRKRAFERISAQFGLESKVLHTPVFTAKDGYDAAIKVLNSGDIPTAIMCINDLVAIGVIKAVRHCKLKVPEDISVVGFGNLSASEFSRPALTTVDMNTTAIGQEMGRLAVNLSHARSLPNNAQVRIPVELIVRESTGPAKT